MTDDDVQSIRLVLDSALYVATRDGHVGDIYDVNATTWAIWLVQRAHALKAGGWTVESDQAQQRLTFEHLYRWLEARHSLHVRHVLRDDATGKVVHRYTLPFKQQKVPPDRLTIFKYRKAARRLSDWVVAGSPDEGTEGLAAGIVDQAPPKLVAPPPGAAQREARSTAAWGRAMASSRARSRTLRSVAGETDDARETREMLDVIMQASRALHPQTPSSTSGERAGPSGSAQQESDEELVSVLEEALREEPAEEEDPNQSASSLTHDEMLDIFMQEELSNQSTSSITHEERGGRPGPSSPESEYEKQRRMNIERNEQVLRELGLHESEPPRPHSRPAPTQRRHRPPPGEPTRASERLHRHTTAPLYSEADADRELDMLLSGDRDADARQ